MFTDIRRRLTLFYALVMASFFVLLVFGSHASMEWSITSEQEREVLLFAEEEAYEHSILFQHQAILDQQNDYKDGSGRMYFYALNLSDEIVNAVRPEVEMESVILARIRSWNIPAGKVEVVHYKETDDLEYKLMMTALPVMINGNKVGMVYVVRDVTAIYSGLRKATLVMGGLATVVLFIATLFGHIMAGKAIVPLRLAYERQRQFTADASHEIRTPLSVIMSSIDVLQNDPSVTSPFLQQIMADMKDEIKKMTKLVSDLLMIARNDSIMAAINREKFNLTLVTEEVMRKMQPLASKKAVKLFFADRHVVELSADLEKIKQVLLILIDNAIKYTPDNGIVTIKLEQDRTVEMVRIIVKDTGIGIKQAEIAKIFDRFYRVDKARSRASGGTGLGLSIAKGFVNLHNGVIMVESIPGEGTKFVVVLPK